MKMLLHPQEATDAPADVLRTAIARNKMVLKIVWDEADGYPEHAWGFIEWSTRPFEQCQGCDGTIDENVHLIAMHLCEALGLDYPTLYEQAYIEQGREYPNGCWLRHYDWTSIENETVIPQLSVESLRGLLYDLCDINNRSIAYLLEEIFSGLGYDVAEWWDIHK